MSMMNSVPIQEDEEGQFIVLPEAYRIPSQSVWIAMNQLTGIITLSPKLSEASEISEAQRLQDIQTMTKMIAATAKNASANLPDTAT